LETSDPAKFRSSISTGIRFLSYGKRKFIAYLRYLRAQGRRTRRTFRGDWTHTGDTYVRDVDGYFRYCGRHDEMLKVSGVWVSPFEVEEALISHPAVLEAAVIGYPDPDGLTKPKAFVVLQERARDLEPATVTELLKTHVKERIGVWKYPRWIVFVDGLPKTATGKIQRFKLREGEAA